MILAFGCNWLFGACQRAPATPVTKQYIFLGHPYHWRHENRIDPRLELLDFSQFDGVWLGGDVCARTSKSAATLNYLDRLFNLKNPTTHWSWGNHDLLEGDEQLLRQATDRNDYYTTTTFDGLQLIVLNTNLFWHHAWEPPAEDCTRKEAQVDWLQQVLDTVQAARELVILHHHGLLNEFKDSTQHIPTYGNVDALNVRIGCDPKRGFTETFYPRLSELQAQGIAVTIVSGDVGMRSKGYELTTPEGIRLLGSGINNSMDMAYPPAYVTNFNPDSVLVFSHQPVEGLSWEFVRLNDLLLEQLRKEEQQDLPLEVVDLLETY